MAVHLVCWFLSGVGSSEFPIVNCMVVWVILSLRVCKVWCISPRLTQDAHMGCILLQEATNISPILQGTTENEAC